MVKQNPSCTGIRDHVFSVRPFRRHLFRCRTFPAQIVSAPIRCSSTVHLFRVSKKHRIIVPKWLRRKVVDPCNTRQRIMVILTPRKEWASITTLVTTADGCSLVAFYVSLDLRLHFSVPNSSRVFEKGPFDRRQGIQRIYSEFKLL